MTPQSFLAPAVAFVLTLCAVCPTHAQPTGGALPPWATEPAPADHTKDIPTDEALLRQHLAGGDSGAVNPPPRARPVAGGASLPSGAQGQRGDGATGMVDSVKDLVKPLHQEVSNSDVVKAVREIDAKVSGRSQTDGPESRPVYGQSDTGAAGAKQSKGASDPNAAALLWQQFLDEVLPWVIGGALVGVFAYGAYVWMKLIKQKNLKLGDKRRAARKDRHAEAQSERHTDRHTDRHSASRYSTNSAFAHSASQDVVLPESKLQTRIAPVGEIRSPRSSSRRSSGRSSSRTPGGSAR